MPEGDSIHWAAAQLHEALAGRELTGSDFRVPRFATLDLAGWTIEEVVARGKHLLMRVLGPSTDPADSTDRGGNAGNAGNTSNAGNAGRQALSIHSHLKMEGTWQVYSRGERWRKPGHTARCILRTSTLEVVGFSLGILDVVRTSDEESVVGYLGPDLLGPDWDPAEAERRIRASPDVAVGVALLDQRNLAGIGNVYRCELCFLARVHPAVPVSEIHDLGSILENARRLLEANVGPTRGGHTDAGPTRGSAGQPSRGPAAQLTRSPAGGPTRRPTGRRTVGVDVIADGLPRTRAGDPHRLSPSYWVYRRERQPCLRCGTAIERGVLGPVSGSEERDIYFCPGCQYRHGP